LIQIQKNSYDPDHSSQLLPFADIISHKIEEDVNGSGTTQKAAQIIKQQKDENNVTFIILS